MDSNNTVLDVEDDDDRRIRIDTLLRKLNTDPTPQPQTVFPKFDFGDRSTFAVNPPAELLSRVHALLPQLQASNEALTQRMQQDPDSINIEHLSEHVNQYIEMNLGLGVFEDRSHKTQQDEDHDAEMSTSSTSASSSSSEELDQYDSDVDSDASEEIITSFVPVRPIKPLPRRPVNMPRSQIMVLEKKSQE